MPVKALSILALLAVASPAFAQAAAEKQSAPVQDQKPFLYDGLMPFQEKPYVDHPVTILSVGGKTATADKSSAVRIKPPPMQPIITPYSAAK
jgi:hypothetical protein